jgi:hypothetical protein
MPTSDATAKDANRRRGAFGGVVLGIAATIDVAVALTGLAAWTSGTIDPKRIDASRIVFSLYGAFGAIALLALIFRWRRWSGFAAAVLAAFAVTWAGLLVVFLVLVTVFGLAV